MTWRCDFTAISLRKDKTMCRWWRPESAVQHFTHSNAKKKRLHSELAPLYRYICKAIPFDFITDSCPEYPMRLRVVRFQIAEGIYENIITNLPSDEFPLEQIKHIYHLRWGQETSFRDLKHTIGTANFHSKSPEYIGFEIL